MKGDFSRQTFDKKKHYRTVLMQQGRVQVDSDWNEQQAIHHHRIETETRDVIGRCGAPKSAAGFEIVKKGTRFFISPGRYYVDGILCENEEETAYNQQPDLPNPPNPIDVFREAKAETGIFYLDVWKRHLTAIDDPRIREVALTGPDTTTRAKTVWQVKILAVDVKKSDVNKLNRLFKEQETLQTKYDKLKASVENFEEIKKVHAALQKLTDEIRQASAEITCSTPFKEWNDLTAPSSGLLNARTKEPGEDKDNPCLLPPSAGYKRLENQLYRVEIHQEGPLGTATFKWSRDNGSVVTTIEKISGKEVTVRDVGPDEVLGFANGQWVEVLDDSLELNQQAGQLIQITKVDREKRIITLASAPNPLAGNADGVDKTRHPKLRRWHEGVPSATSTGIRTSSTWIDLEGDIQVQFSSGSYHVGDYWLIPARTATGEIEWPPFEIPNTNPVAQPPLGIQHHYCRLALAFLDTQKETLTVQDCRRIYFPLTEPPSAIHITDVSWRNDDLLPLDRFMKEGLEIKVDATSKLFSVSRATFIVTTEIAFLSQPTETTPDVSYVLDGEITMSPGSIRWKPVETLAAQFREYFKNHSSGLMRVTLKGRTIWTDLGEDRLYLDGQVFGQPGLRDDNKTPCTDLVLPSGDGARASDFESWFYLTGSEVLKIKTVSFYTAAGKNSSVGDIQVPPIPKNIQFKTGERVNTVKTVFNRVPAQAGLDGPDKPQSLGVVNIKENKETVVPGNIKVENQVVTFTAAKSLTKGSYAFVALGNTVEERPAIKAEDDGTALDGDFDGQPGGNFILPFQVT